MKVGAHAKAIPLLVALQLAAPLARAGAQSAPAAQEGAEQYVPAAPTGYVSDFASVLDPASEARMTDLITRLRGVTRAEMAVVTLPTIGDREAAEVALAIGRRWRVGDDAELGDPTRNAGIVVLLVPREGGRPGSGHIRIEVGQGLEGIITDALAGRVRDNVMGPLLAEERYGDGLTRGVEALASAIARGYGVSDSTLREWRVPVPTGGGGGSSIMGMLPLLLFFLFVMMASRSSRRGRRRRVYWGGPWIGGGGWGGGWGGGGGGGWGGGGGFGGFGGGGGFSGGGAGGRF